MVLPDWKGVTQNQRTNARDRGEMGERIRVDKVPKEAESGCVIHIASLNINTGQVGGLDTEMNAL